MLMVTVHLGLALNALRGNRDLLSSVYTVRALGNSTPGKGRAQGTVGFPELRRGRVALAFTAVIARSTGRPEPHMDFAMPAQACGIAKGHLGYDHALEDQGHIRTIRDAAGLDAQMAEWEEWDARHPGEETESPPLGFDLQPIAALLSGQGYTDADVAAIMHGNWCRFLRRAWASAPR